MNPIDHKYRIKINESNSPLPITYLIARKSILLASHQRLALEWKKEYLFRQMTSASNNYHLFLSFFILETYKIPKYNQYFLKSLWYFIKITDHKFWDACPTFANEIYEGKNKRRIHIFLRSSKNKWEARTKNVSEDSVMLLQAETILFLGVVIFPIR